LQGYCGIGKGQCCRLCVSRSRSTTTNSHITLEFSCKFVKKICKKRLFPAIFSNKFNWQVIPSWVIISYKIIKFASISYKICCEKCFIQNILQTNWQQFPVNLFFITKFISISYKKNFKTKLAGNMSFFSSEGAVKEFFYVYMCHFSQLHIRMSFDDFTIGVLRLLNVAPTQLHLNSCAYLQAFRVLCKALYLKAEESNNLVIAHKSTRDK